MNIQMHCNDPKVFIKYPNAMDDIYENIDEYNLNKKCKTSILLDDMIADMFIDMFRLLIRNLIVTELC